MPELNILEYTYADIYQTCSGARDGMSGAINYNVIIDVAKTQGIKEFDDLLYYVKEVEHYLHEKRESTKATKG